MALSGDIATPETSLEPPMVSETGEQRRPSSNERELRPLDPIRILGQFLVWIGGILVLFALFQLWGTGLLEARAQDKLDQEFKALIAEAAEVEVAEVDSPAAEIEATELTPAEPAPTAEEVAEPETPQPVPETPAEPTLVPVGSDLLPGEGQAMARIRIDSIGVNKTVVQGVQRDTLREGPGHYPTSPMPGQLGNAAIAGHRTTHGAPFFNLDQVQPGDHIDVETLDGIYRYEVQAHTGPDGNLRGFFIVDPSDVSVIGDHGDNRLTLTACHPRYSARQRIVVNALLIGEASPTPVVVAEPVTTAASLPAEATPEVTPEAPAEAPVDREAPVEGEARAHQSDPAQTIVDDQDLLERSLGWQKQELDPTIMWATVTMVVLHAAWVFGRVWRRRYAYVLGLPTAVVPLFICFIHLDRLLPAF